MAKKQKEARRLIKLVHEETGQIYYSTKNFRNTVDKLSLKKYNSKTKKHELFVEKK